jgi:DNA-binding CsgD family transcriptional regulator
MAAMSDMCQATLKLTNDVAGLATPAAVLIALQNLSRSIFGIGVLGAWSLPRYIKERVEPREIGVNLWLHPDIPVDYWPRYRDKFTAHGLSVLALKARTASVPFTFAEAGKENRAQQTSNWVFGFMESLGIRDGLYCVYRNWSLVFISPRLLALSPANRTLLGAAGQIAVGRIEQMIKANRRRRRRGNSKGIDLTPRERDVLQQRAFFGSNAAVAKEMDISVDTVETHLRNIRKKLRVDDTAIALLEAYKHGFIEY